MNERQNRTVRLVVAIGLLIAAWAPARGDGEEKAAGATSPSAVVVLLGRPGPGRLGPLVERARRGEGIFYFQLADAEEVDAVRRAAEKAGVLGRSVFVALGDLRSIHLADNLADEVVVGEGIADQVDEREIVRVLYPGAKAVVAGREIVKPAPSGTDDWSHVFHRADNNPQSTDRVARAPYLTQFLGDPLFCPMPEVSVAAGGRVFRAFGHIAHKANQNAMLNTLLCVNGYNGQILWRRGLREGFMIHRNTMIATPEVFYLADDESCKLIDAATGEVRGEIVVPEGIADGPVWKWIALQDGVLYALVGGRETRPATQRSQVPGLGHWPWGMWDGHEYADPATSYGFGRTFAAFNPRTKEPLWTVRTTDYVDARGVCMRGGRIYFYCPEKFVGCIDAGAGKMLWQNSDAELIEAIGPNARAQHYLTGYATTTYVKCNDRFLFFAGPQRSRLVVASTKDGKLAWQKEPGNYQLVLRDDAIYAAGPQNADVGCKLDYETGEVLAHLPARRACTRATGSVDSIFYRASGGTVRIDAATGAAKHIAPMRPPCQDGVIISDGMLYWGPWMCGCQLSLYGHVCLTPAGAFDFRPGLDDRRLEPGEGDPASVEPFPIEPGDWPTYLADARRTATTSAAIPRQIERQWTFDVPSGAMPTAPIVAGNTVFFGDRAGILWALDARGNPRWKAYTGGAIYVAPALADGRLYAGSADGRVYAFEAATGRRLWSFRVGPADRRIPVYGKLISTWPVAGGVVVDDGVVYAAAGITHYDGTHVVALDAVTGKPKWYNDSSGSLSEQVDSGVSLQGELFLADGELRFVGGGVIETARYDLATGRCLNAPYDQPNARFHTAFHAYYPDYARYLTLEHKLADGRTLVYDASYEGSRHGPLALLTADSPSVVKPVSRWYQPPRQAQAKAHWQDKTGRRFNGFAVSSDVLLAAGHTGGDQVDRIFLAAVHVGDGSDLWREELPAPAVRGGVAVDRAGRIVVALEDGRLIGYGPAGAD